METINEIIMKGNCEVFFNENYVYIVTCYRSSIIDILKYL